MYETIMFPIDRVLQNYLNYWGRNKGGICHGIEISTWHDLSKIQLIPINSAEKPSSSCYMQIPGDPMVLRQIAETFYSVADSIEKKEIHAMRNDLTGAVAGSHDSGEQG